MPAHMEKQGNSIYIYIYIYAAHIAAHIPREKLRNAIYIYIYIYMRRRYRRISKKQDVDTIPWPAGDAKLLKIHCFSKQKSYV